MLSIADILTIINNFLSAKFYFIDAWKPWFFDHPEWDTIGWLLSGYLIYFQSILHSSIAINRAWIAFSLMLKNHFWPKLGRKLIWFLPLIPLAIVSPRFSGHSVMVYTDDGEISTSYLEKDVALYHSVAGPTVILSTSAISFILLVTTIFRYRYLFKQFNKTVFSTMKQDMLLFFQAFLLLIFQLALAAYYIVRFLARAQKMPEVEVFAMLWFDYNTDISSLINPIALLLVCKFIRKDYIDFTLRRKPFSTFGTGNNSSLVQRSPKVISVI